MAVVVPAFASGRVQRNAALRSQSDALVQIARVARVLQIWKGQVPVRGETGLWLACDLAPDLAPDMADTRLGPEAIFLGTAEGVEVLAQNLGDEDVPPHLPEGCEWADLRQCLLLLTPDQAELAATAKALFSWHRTHRFCSACGQPSQMSEAGWQRRCPACQTVHFPRTDPVVIMLITQGDQLLLGRSPGWPEGMYSTLAGFMEPGETIEAAVRREVAEETGIEVGTVRYLASQPWPFPSSLMLGCHGHASSTAITIDPAEIEDALWISRSDMVMVLAGQHPRIKPMRRGAIAHSLVVNWLSDRQY